MDNAMLRRGLIIMAAGLSLHEITFAFRTMPFLQVGGLALETIGAGIYAQALGKRTAWGLLALLSCPGILLLFILLSPESIAKNGTPNQASDVTSEPAPSAASSAHQG
jgi:hypothetical protein